MEVFFLPSVSDTNNLVKLSCCGQLMHQIGPNGHKTCHFLPIATSSWEKKTRRAYAFVKKTSHVSVCEQTAMHAPIYNIWSAVAPKFFASKCNLLLLLLSRGEHPHKAFLVLPMWTSHTAAVMRSSSLQPPPSSQIRSIILLFYFAFDCRDLDESHIIWWLVLSRNSLASSCAGRRLILLSSSAGVIFPKGSAEK